MPWLSEEEWMKRFANDARVMLWLKKNPPPKFWQSDPLRYAYLEMPVIWLI